MNKKTDLKPSSKFVSVTNTTATISTISSTTLSNTVTTSACVSSKFSLSTPLVSTNYKIPSQPLHSSPPTLVKNSSSSSQGISKYDISTYYKKSLNLTNIEKNDLIKNVSIVEPSFEFPINTNTKRHFQHDWLKKYPWLRYSISENGGYCLPCVLFAKHSPGKLQCVSNLVKNPVIASSSSKTLFKRHEESPTGLHSFCQNAYVKFLESFSGKSKPIDKIVNDIVKNQVLENRGVFLFIG